MKRKTYKMIFVLCIGLFLAAGACIFISSYSSGKKEDGKKEETEPKLTIWLDEDNEYYIRRETALYMRLRDSGMGAGQEDDITDLDFELVPKNSLSAQQYREELNKALESGEGPDIIFIDAYNGVNPLELMEAGRLAPLGEKVTESYGEELEYAAGALEAGQMDGENYVLPISMECPVVFGIREELEAAGIQTDTMYASLGEFLDALLAAQEKTGKMIFESPAAADWLEQYYLPQDGSQELSEKLARVRSLSASRGNRTGAYDMLSKGECLLGGCGIYDFRKLGLNAAWLGKQKLALLAIPDSSGSVCGLITHAAAVNAGSPHVQEAIKALSTFQAGYFLQDITVIAGKDYSILTSMNTILMNMQSKLALPELDISDEIEKDFIRCSIQACSRMSYVQEYGGRDSHTETSDGEKKTASICFANTGDGEEYPAGQWLEKAADEYMQSHDDTYLQLLSVEENPVILPDSYKDMDSVGAAPDALLGSAAERMAAAGLKFGSGVDFGSMLEDSSNELDFLPDVLKGGVRYGGAAVGLPVQVREYGVWTSRRMLEKAGLAEGWKPSDAGELTEGMKQLAKTAGPSYMVFNRNELNALALFAEPDSLLVQQEDGSVRCSKESWVSVLDMLKGWKDAGIVLPAVGMRGKPECMQKLADGETGMVFGCSDLSGYIDGAYGVAMTKEQQEDLVFLTLSPAADVDILFVSGRSDSAGEVFAFWKEALQHPDYAESIHANSGIPVTEVSETVRQILPLQDIKTEVSKLRKALWETDAPAQELAEQCPLYEWAQD